MLKVEKNKPWKGLLKLIKMINSILSGLIIWNWILRGFTGKCCMYAIKVQQMNEKVLLTLMTFYKLQVLFLAVHFSPLRLQGTIQIRITLGVKKQLTTM